MRSGLRNRAEATEKDSDGEKGIQRIEAFSDGIFAIAITLLVLDIRVTPPPGMDRVSNLAASLGSLWPYYSGYLFSFLVVGIYWANHHYLFRFFKRTNHVFNLLNVLFLMCISFLPFPTAVLSEYITDPHNRHTAVSFYTLGLLLPAISWLLIWLYGSAGGRLIDRSLTPEFVRYLSRQYILSPILYAFALAISFVSGNAALAVAIGLTLLYLFPSKKPAYQDPSETEETQ